MDPFDSTFFVTAVSITVVILVISTFYTVTNVMKIWRAGKPTPVKKESEKENEDSEESDDPITHDNSHGGGDAPDISNIDPMEYCEHIQSEVKKAKIRVAEKRIGETMTPEQIAEEKDLQRKQLEEIFKLMQDQNDKFGVSSVEDIQNQMKLYA